MLFQNFPLPPTSEDVKRIPVNIVEQNIRIANEPTPKTTESPLRICSVSRGKSVEVHLTITLKYLEELNTPTASYSTPPPKSPQPFSSRTLKGMLSCPLPTPELTSECQAHFRLIIQDGMIKEQTENFLQFRQFFYGIWGKIVKVFRALEKLMTDYVVPIALINGGR